jgi:membrane protein
MGAAARQAVEDIFPLVKETFAEFQRHNVHWLAAGIAYFTILAVAPLIIVVAEIAGLFLGQHQAVLDSLYGYMSSSAGPSAAHGIQAIVVATSSQRKAGLLAQLIAWMVFVVAAVGLFTSLQEAVNTIWDVTPAKKRFFETIKGRMLSFGMVLGIAFLLLVSLGVNVVLTIASRAMADVIPGFPTWAKVLNFGASFAMVTALFALLFEYLPERRIAWRDVWLGATVSAVFFVVGQFLLGWYLGRAGVSSGYGAFGGLVVFMIWTYYSAQIVLSGAAFTHVYARRVAANSRDMKICGKVSLLRGESGEARQ